MMNIVHRIYTFYREGFRSMTLGRSLWLLILIKLAIIFLILKLFFFPDILQTEYPDDAARSNAVRSNLINN